ncbi:uncharacterized protein LOC120106666 [Phoenix dactylifera]|uniref:Uncharacterized protein LOC103712625 n=1 Tax=Phoenix dactylifera TaxID=42345 RepID=A0A8B7CEA7_PHODC|nr:uncharacterized protein LOC103712625 [Phoenix dactylifera]XP_038975620.1 uncharacterized protein LOC120106666 [Phoenix dactylifera]
MAKISPFSILLMFLLLIGLMGVAELAATGGGSIHELLREHGLPAGLLPKAVESFDLDRDSGLLEVRLERPCYAVYDGLAYFDRVVRGNLSHGALRGVEGFSQEELFLWLPVKGILVSDPSSGIILIDIVLAHKQLSLSLFEEPPDCQPAVRQVIGEGLFGRKVGLQGRREI